MTPAHLECQRRRRQADLWYGLGFIAAGAPVLALVLTWFV
jgi:hypothetical protein